ncbi:MAG: chlorohydrolase family protein [Gudongella sp.]|nr:chlorohydrolase family protein [Gudongella sp.]
MITKIKGKYVIGFDGHSHVIIEDGEVVYEGNTVVYVGENYSGSYDKLIEEKDSIISPGFIDLDALGDIDHALIFNEIDADKRKDLYWSEEYFDNYRDEYMTEEEESFKSLYAYSQLISNGITTAMPITSVNYKKAGETFEEIEAAVHHAGRLGIRVYLGPSYVSGMHVVDSEGNVKVKWMVEEGRDGLLRAEEFIKKYHGMYDGLINGVMVPERIELQTEEILLKSKEISDRYKCPIRLHAAQGEFEYNTIYGRTGMSTIKYLDSIGFLDKRTLIPHTIYSSGSKYLEDNSNEDQEVLKKRGSSVIHCPLVYARSGHALNSFGRYRRIGVNMAMGTDTFPPDMIRNINIGSTLGLHQDGGNPENNFAEFFNAATLGGSKALGRHDLGRLCVGAKADIIVIDLSGFHIGTIDDPLRTLFLSGSGRDVKTSIINGKIVMEDYKIAGIDYEEMKNRAQEYFNKMKEGYAYRSRNKNLNLDSFSYKKVQ